MDRSRMTQDDMKRAAARAALAHLAEGRLVGVGTGSTARFFIEELAAVRERVAGAVASSEDTRRRLEAHGIKVFDLNEVVELPVYIDGADEITAGLHVLKGGGGALTREKIVAAVATTFVCIVDQGKLVETLGRFPLPVEVIPMARAQVERKLAALGGTPVLRPDFVTDNGNLILDVRGLDLADPVRLEKRLDGIVGIVENGLFARRPADVCLVGTVSGVRTLAGR